MGGEWGVSIAGASNMRHSLARLLSGILQSGYSIGYLLQRSQHGRYYESPPGWRWMFWIGGLPRCWHYISVKVPESEA